MLALKSNPQVALKPQDVIVLFKLFVWAGDKPPSYRYLAEQLEIGVSEVHASVNRLVESGLVLKSPGKLKPMKAAARDFILKGAIYSFPAVRDASAVGVPTSWGAAPLNKHINQAGLQPPVWPCAEGLVRGDVLYPLYPTAPQAALNDPRLHEMLALFDAIRSGRARERSLGAKLLKGLLK